jgi:hypothetical protein
MPTAASLAKTLIFTLSTAPEVRWTTGAQDFNDYQNSLIYQDRRIVNPKISQVSKK